MRTKEEIQQEIDDIDMSMSILPEAAKEDAKAEKKALQKELADLHSEETEKATEAKKKAAKESAPVAKKPKKAIATVAEPKLKGYLDEVLDNYELNLPFHAGISPSEKKKVAKALAKDAANHFNVEEAEVLSMCEAWLEKANAKAEKEMKVSGRRPIMDDEKEAVKGKVAKREGKRAPKEPQPKKQFGTKLREGVVIDVKRAAAAFVKKKGGKDKVTQEDIACELAKVEGAGMAFFMALADLAGTKNGGSMAEKFKKDLKDFLSEFKEEEEVKADAPKKKVKSNAFKRVYTEHDLYHLKKGESTKTFLLRNLKPMVADLTHAWEGEKDAVKKGENFVKKMNGILEDYEVEIAKERESFPAEWPFDVEKLKNVTNKINDKLKRMRGIPLHFYNRLHETAVLVELEIAGNIKSK